MQINETAKRLKERGHQISVQNSDEPDVTNADIVHIFNCRVYDSFVKQYNACVNAGKPIVVSPIWISLDRAIWGSRGTFAILERGNKYGEDRIKNELIAKK